MLMLLVEPLKNDEIRMTKDEGIAKLENAATCKRLGYLVIISAFDIRASSFSSFVVND